MRSITRTTETQINTSGRQAGGGRRPSRREDEGGMGVEERLPGLQEVSGGGDGSAVY